MKIKTHKHTHRRNILKKSFNNKYQILYFLNGALHKVIHKTQNKQKKVEEF